MNALGIKIAAVVAAIIILGGGGFFIYSKNKAQTAPASQTATVSATPSSNSATQSLANILGGGGNKKCTFSEAGTTGGSTNGTIFVSGTNVHGDFTITTSSGKTETDHIIRIGDQNYIWGDSFPSGIKMTMSLQQFANNQQTSQTFNTNQKANFNCGGWSVDASMFTPPASVHFMDLGNISASPSTGGTQPTSNPNSSACAACSTLTGAAKTACMSSLHC